MARYKIKQQKDGWYRVYERCFLFFWEKTFGCYLHYEDADFYLRRCQEHDRNAAGQKSWPHWPDSFNFGPDRKGIFLKRFKTGT